MRACHDGFDQLIHEFGAIAAVPIEKHNDVAFPGKRADSRRTGATITAFGFSDHFCSGFTSALRSSISTAVVDHDDLAWNFGRRNGMNYIPYRLLFVQSRNDNAHPTRDSARRRHLNTIHALVK